jgi:hypothetical protein
LDRLREGQRFPGFLGPVFQASYCRTWFVVSLQSCKGDWKPGAIAELAAIGLGISVDLDVK